jgi:hypothetical protein
MKGNHSLPVNGLIVFPSSGQQKKHRVRFIAVRSDQKEVARCVIRP